MFTFPWWDLLSINQAIEKGIYTKNYTFKKNGREYLYEEANFHDGSTDDISRMKYC